MRRSAFLYRCWTRGTRVCPRSFRAGKCRGCLRARTSCGWPCSGLWGLPYRQQFGSIATWLAEQARGNGSEIKLTSPVTRENICLRKAGSCCRRVRSALPARWLSRTNWKAIAGWETGKCVSSDEVALDKVSLTSGEALVIDEMADVAAPLTAVKLAKQGVRTRLFDKMANDRNGNGSRGVFPLDYDVCARSKSRGPYVAYC
jgi:hypothetical protein